NRAFGPGVLGGEDAVGAAAAADVEDAVARLDLHHLGQGAGAVVEAAVGEGAGPRQEAARLAAADAGLERHLVAAPRPVALAAAPEDRVGPVALVVDAAEHLLEQA